MKEKIKLPNRYDDEIYLVNIIDDIYYLELPEGTTYRLIGTHKNPIAVDPSGGPFISVGSEFEGYVVKEIIYRFGLNFILEKK